MSSAAAPFRPPTAPGGGIDRERLHRALRIANMPTLLMVLFHLTGDERWLSEPFSPTPPRGQSPHDAGGLAPATAAEVRAAAEEAIAAWADGRPMAAPEPDRETLRRMASTSVAEPIPDEYEALLREELGLDEDPVPETPAPGDDLDVVIVGAGVSGLLAAIRLKQGAVPFTILEREDDVGGVWHANRYPGAGVDTPSYLYSASAFPWHWSTHFGKRDEMAAYLRALADEHELCEHIRFGTTVDELLWDDANQRWEVHGTTARGEPLALHPRAVISAIGTFNTPSVPAIPGLDRFAGRIAHTAQWPQDLELSGQRVAVIGAGASGQQVVPAIVDDVAELHVLQRSPQWIAPNDEYFAPVSDDVHWLMEHVPLYHAWYRARLAWTFNDRIHASLQVDPDWEHPDRSLNAVNEGHRRFFERYVAEQLEGRPDLIEKSLPAYPPFGKRMLLDNGWYAALRRDHVTLDTAPIEAVVSEGVRTADGLHEVDVLILATGFQARRYLPFQRVQGRDGRTVRELWGDDDAAAHLGMTIPGFPNLFLLYGPNTNSGSGGSVIFIVECQVRYVMALVSQLRTEALGTVEPRPEALASWIDEVDAAHGQMIWSHPGMTTYYRNAKGRIVTNSPFRIVDYWARTREPRLEDFRFGRRAVHA